MSTQSAVDKWAEYQATKRENSAKKPKRKRCGACATVYDGARCPECHPVTRPTLTVAPTSPEPAPFEAEPLRECAACGTLYVPPPRPFGTPGYPPRRCPECVESGRRRRGKVRRQKPAEITAPAPEPLIESVPDLAMETEPETESETGVPATAPAPAENDIIDAILRAVASVRPGVVVRFVYVETRNA